LKKRIHWTAFKSFKLVEQINSQTRIIHITSDSGTFSSSRDYVVLEYCDKVGENSYLISWNEVEHKDYLDFSKNDGLFLILIFNF